MSQFNQNLIRSQILNVNTTQVGTDADTAQKTLASYTLPANKLNSNGKAIRVTAWGTLGANANSKTTKLYFGSTAIHSRTAADNGLDWSIEALIVRTGASGQKSRSYSLKGTTFGKIEIAAPSEDTTSSIVIKVTGKNGTAAANDVVLEAMVVEFLV